MEQSNDYHQRAQDIRIKALRPTHVDVCVSYQHLGNVCRKMGEFEQAEDYYQRALELRIKALGSDHLDRNVGNF